MRTVAEPTVMLAAGMELVWMGSRLRETSLWAVAVQMPLRPPLLMAEAPSLTTW